MFNKIEFAKILTKINNSYDTMTEFAEKSEVNRTYLSQYINQKLDSPPTPKILMKIAKNSHNLITYEKLMAICGYIIDDVNKNLDEVRNAEKTLSYNNMVKKLLLNKKEKEIVDKINSSFDNYVKTFSIENSKIKSLDLLDTLDISDCDIIKIKKALETYIISQCAKTLINSIYKNTVEIDTKSNYIETLNKLNVLSNDIETLRMCPIVGKIAAGQPILAQENIEGYLPVDPNVYGMSTSEDLFYLRVSGESMNKIVKNGDYALIHKQDYADNGDIIVAIVNGDDEATLKRYRRINEELIILEPMSSLPMEPLVINLKETPFKIIGKAIGQFGKF